MVQTKRAQILMAPEEYRRLEAIARLQEVSVAELIRKAVRERYFTQPKQPHHLVESICSMNLPVSDWDTLEEEIAEAHSGPLS